MQLLGKMILLAMAFFLALSLHSCGDGTKGQADIKRPEVRDVTIMVLAPSTVESFYETSGTVRAKATSVLASRVFGSVTDVHVKEGDKVRAGDVLASLDDADASQRLKAAESAYSEALKAREAARAQSGLADITHGRYANLYREKVVSGQEFDQVTARKNVANLELERASLGADRARALLEESRVQYGFTKVRAPFSGLVTAKKAEKGSMAIPGMPLLTVEDVSRFKIEAYVDERLSQKLKEGVSIQVLFDAAKGPAPAVITRVVPAVDPASRTFAIEAELEGPSLRSGLYGKVFIPDGKREALLVPREAVVEKGQLTGVYTVDEKGVVAYRLIRIGKAFNGGIEALSGLKKGDRIIVRGTENAADGGIIKDHSASGGAR